MRLLFLVFISLSTFSVVAQKALFETGKILDSLSVNTSTQDTYALYLPKSFNPKELAPIVFIFEPMARGKIGITPFIKASEKYGHILVCSNDSRNGPMERNFEITDRLFQSIFSQFSIDPKQMYTAGFSGGARLASTIAVATNQFAGVIACGAAFSSYLNLTQGSKDFSYAMIIGDEDMNLLELYKTKDYITKLKIPNELFVYEMNHKWPSQDQILDAFDWLYLESLKKDTVTKNTHLIATIYSNYYKKAYNLENEDKLLYASENYHRMVRTFSRFFDIDSISNRLDNLTNTKELKKTKRQLKIIFEREIKLRNLFAERFTNDLKKRKKNLNWWKSEINKLKKENENAGHHKKKMLNRVLYNTFAMAIEKATVGNSLESIDQVIFCFDICIAVYPEYHRLYFKQAENYLNKNQPERAIDYLEDLLKTGYSNIELIKKQKTFQILKSNERFLNLVKN